MWCLWLNGKYLGRSVCFRTVAYPPCYRPVPWSRTVAKPHWANTFITFSESPPWIDRLLVRRKGLARRLHFLELGWDNISKEFIQRRVWPRRPCVCAALTEPNTDVNVLFIKLLSLAVEAKLSKEIHAVRRVIQGYSWRRRLRASKSYPSVPRGWVSCARDRILESFQGRAI